MGTIIRPTREKKAVRRPAWLYPEGTQLLLGDRSFTVVRDYGTEEYDPSYGNGGPILERSVRSSRYWAED